MQTSIKTVANLCVVVSFLLTGCGGGGSNPGGSSSGNSTQPTVSSITPTTVTAGSGPLTLTVNGTGFQSSTTVQVGGVADVTSYVSSTQVTATVEPTQMAIGGQLSVIALNGSASSGWGAAVNLQVTNPVPVITQFTPAALPAGAASPTLTIAGTGFVPTTTIDINGNARATVFVSATQVSVTLNASDVASTGSLSLTAVNAAPGGGVSTAMTVPVNNPAPRVTSVTPTVVLTGTATPTTVTVTGTNFIPASTVELSGVARTTTYVSSTQLTFQLTVADEATTQQIPVAVMNPAPGGGTFSAGALDILPQTPTPVITGVSPSQFVVGSGTTQMAISGSNLFAQLGSSLLSGSFIPTSSVQWNGTTISSGFIGFSGLPSGYESITVQVPATLLATAGTATITVTSMTATPAVSNAFTVTIANPPAPTLTSIYPAAGPINTATTVTLDGTGFTSNSTVAINGAAIAATFVNPTELTVTIPASSVALPGNLNFTVTTPPPGGGTTAPLPFTGYIGIQNNDIVYNATDGLLYASVPSSESPAIANSVVGIDPVSGNIERQIFAGSNPNKIALSSDGTQLFVGLDGAGAVAQINLTKGQVTNRFQLGGSQYDGPSTATYLAAVPGEPNSVAVASNGSVSGVPGETIYDSGVARANGSYSYIYGSGPLAFGSSASTLFEEYNSSIYELTVDSTGITGEVNLYSPSSYFLNYLQYDNGRLYLSNGAVLDASTGAQLGTFYASASSPASGPVVSDSTLGLAFVGEGTSYNGTPQVLAFNESTFNPTGSIPFNNSSGNAINKIVRWGQNGLALNTPTQIYILQSPVVKDLSASPADLSLTLGVPATASTGNAISYIASVKNQGPGQAQGIALSLVLDPSLIVNSISASQGACGSGGSLACSLGNLANGATATVTVSVTPTLAGSIQGSANVSSVSYDPAAANDQANAATTVTGSLYGAVPAVSGISPAFVQAGSSSFTLTVNGSGFNTSSTINLNGTGLSTTYVSPTELTANVDATAIAGYGWAPVTITNPSPGGGTSQVAPLTIYTLLSVPANAILFDPYSQQIYAALPSASVSPVGNSVVTINPVTGAVGTPVNVGSEPNLMAETTDGNNLYIGLSGANSLVRFDLLQQKVAATIPISITQYGTTAGEQATALAAMPGSDTTLAMNVQNSWNVGGIFDVNGNTGSFRQNTSDFGSFVDPIFADAAHLYAFESNVLYRYSVDANGITFIDQSTLSGLGYSGFAQLAGGVLFGSGGGIINPSTTPPTQIAMLPSVAFYSPGLTTDGVAVVADPSTQKAFLMLENDAGIEEYALARYDASRYLPEAWVTMPTSMTSSWPNWKMLRWGQDGLALLSAASDQINSQAASEILLLRGPFVTPQLLESNPPASLTSSSVTSIAHGAGNTLLTLTGSNFLPGVAVNWNGSYRTTTIVDATHVTVAIPASDLANAGSGSLVAINPGASASSALVLQIN